jgi:hypothetical protein
MSEVTSE